MKKSTIIKYHLSSFVLGAIVIVSYLFFKISQLSGASGVAVAIVGPAIMIAYVVGLGILCGISLGIFLLIAYLHKK